MNPRWDESEFVFCDLQAAARYIRRDNPAAARAFLEAAYNTFEFLARNPGIGRKRADFTGAPLLSNVAAPEDGRTPITLPPRSLTDYVFPSTTSTHLAGPPPNCCQ